MFLQRFLFLFVGFLFLVLGFIGIFLPLLPTTPFVLLAAFCFSKGSKRLHRWLLGNRLFGDLIRSWEEHGVIRPRVKWLSTALIVVMLSFPIGFMPIPGLLKFMAGMVGLGVILFIQTRPNRQQAPPPPSRQTEKP